MMTNERIKEELENSYDSEIDEDAFRFGLEYQPTRDGSTVVYRNIARGFYAGFKTAERLAKIEVLEELISTANELKLETLSGALSLAKKMISEL